MMQKWPLYIVFGCAFGVLALSGALRVEAAQLWNKPSTQNTEKKSTIYNSPVTNRNGMIYNSQLPQQTKVSASSQSLSEALKGYQTIRMTEQTDSALFAFMSPNAVMGRQSDIDHALKQEYQTRIETSKAMISMFKKDAQIRAVNERKHEQRVADWQAKKDAKEAQKKMKKERAVAAMKKGVTPSVLSSASRSGSSAKKTIYNSTQSSGSSTGMKTPKKLYNTKY